MAGHTGLVGSAILRHLQASGHLDLVFRTRAELDLTCQAATDAFFEKEQPEYVFVAAAKVGGIYANDTFPADFIRQNLFIAANVIDAAYRHGVKKLLYLGSSCLYPKFAQQPMKEPCLLTGLMEPTNQWYGIAKVAGIKMCQAYAKQHGFCAICAMPTNLYGPGDTFDLQNSHVLPALIRKFHLAKAAAAGNFAAIDKDEALFGPLGQEMRERLFSIAAFKGHKTPGPVEGSVAYPDSVVLWGTGSPLREFLYVDDLARAVVFLMQEYESPEIINVGAGTEVSIRALADMARQEVGYEGPVVWDAQKPDGSPRKLLDCSAMNSLGWKPETGLAQGIKNTYAWYLKKSGIIQERL